MAKKTVLITNVQDFAGPPALQGLWSRGFRVLAHDPAFTDDSQAAAFARQYPDVVVLSEQNPTRLVEVAWSHAGQVDALICNPSYPAIHASVDEADINALRATLEHVVTQPFALLQAAVPRFKHQQRGNIIVVTSCRQELPMPGGAIPDLARSALDALIKTLSIELAPHQIPVNGIAPNFLYSEVYFPKAQYQETDIGRDFIKSVVPAGRLGDPKELADLVCYLAELRGSFQTGAIIKFAGGWPAAPLRPEFP